MKTNKSKKYTILEIEDKGQDFLELAIDKDLYIKGNSPIFANRRMKLLGVGTADGKTYYHKKEVFENIDKLKGLLVYMYEAATKEPVPWKARTLNYKITN